MLVAVLERHDDDVDYVVKKLKETDLFLFFDDDDDTLDILIFFCQKDEKC